MQQIIFIVLAIIIVLWLYKRFFSMPATVQSMAKIQLKKYHELTGGKKLTYAEKDDVYLKLIQSRPGLTKNEDEAYEIKAMAHDLCSTRDGFLDADVNLMWVVLAMWAKEQSMHGRQIDGATLTKAYRNVRKVISEEL